MRRLSTDAGITGPRGHYLDNGNNIRRPGPLKRTEDAFDFPGFVPPISSRCSVRKGVPSAGLHSAATRRISPSRTSWSPACSSNGSFAALALRLAKKSPSRGSLRASAGWDRGKDRSPGLAFNELVRTVKVSPRSSAARDHLDTGYVLLPPGRRGILDAAMRIAAGPCLCIVTTAGASW